MARFSETAWIRVPPHTQGRKARVQFDVVIEIPKGSRNKYEVDHDRGG